MKKLKLLIQIWFKVFLTLLIVCGSSDDSINNPDPSENSGAAHTSNITLDSEQFSGEVDNILFTAGNNGAVPSVSPGKPWPRW